MAEPIDNDVGTYREASAQDAFTSEGGHVNPEPEAGAERCSTLQAQASTREATVIRDVVSAQGAAVLQSAYFDDAAECVRFWVLVGGEPVGASISRQTLHYCYCPHARSEDHLKTYEAHAAGIDAAVRRRIAQGAIEPVIVREHDLHA